VSVRGTRSVFRVPPTNSLTLTLPPTRPATRDPRAHPSGGLAQDLAGGATRQACLRLRRGPLGLALGGGDQVEQARVRPIVKPGQKILVLAMTKQGRGLGNQLLARTKLFFDGGGDAMKVEQPAVRSGKQPLAQLGLGSSPRSSRVTSLSTSLSLAPKFR